MKKLSRTWRIAILSALALLLILILVLRPVPLPVDAGLVTRGPLQVTIEAEGVARVVDKYTVSAPVSGRLLRIPLDEGVLVLEGSAVASILPPDLDPRELREAQSLAGTERERLAEAQARQRQVAVRLAQARRTAERYNTLFKEGAVSRESWEQAREESQVLERELAAAASASSSASFQLQAAQARLGSGGASRPYPVTSPVDGTVIRIHEENERIVPAGTPLVDIGDPNRLEIVIDVLSSDAVRIRPGNRVFIDGWGGGERITARVARVEPGAFTKVSALGIEEKRVNVIAVPDRPEPRLGDNFRVQSTILLQSVDNVLRAPVSSLFRDERGWNVFVIEHGRAQVRSVRIGLRGTDMVQVLGGLSAGTKVVLHPVNDLQDGMRVEGRE